MRWFKHTLSILLVLVAVGVALATIFSDHSDDYGRVTLPQGGTVHLPEGKVTVFYRVEGGTSELEQNASGVAFQVVPARGGQPVATTLENSEVSEVAVQRSETIGELGAVAKLDVPAAGDYVVSGDSGLQPGASSLEFGTNAASALVDRWRLLAGLLLGALLLAIIPVPRRDRRLPDATGQNGWSSNPRAPYAG
jgi:hypothetical protein